MKRESIMFKDEAPYLREWIEYHHMIGVDHFYLYDNNSKDEYETVILPYVESGLVTVIKWPELHAQVRGYEDCIRRFQNESDWIGFIDVDEFVVPIEDEMLPQFLNRFSHRPAVLLYWRFFGSGGKMKRDISKLVMEDFVVASEKIYDKGKCFFNSNYDYLFDDPSRNKSMFHMMWTVSKGVPLPPVDIFDEAAYPHRISGKKAKRVPIQINHYAVKSFEEHKQKDVKGDVYYDHPTHGDDVFFMRERRCSSPDFRILRYVTELKTRMGNPEHE